MKETNTQNTGKQIELDMIKKELETQENLSNEMDFEEVDFDILNHTEHNRNSKSKPKTEQTKRKGRPHKSISILNRKKVQNKTFSFTLPQYQKEVLQFNAKKEDRSLSDYIKNTLKNIRAINKPILKDLNKAEKSEMVQITISISTKEHQELLNYSKKLDRKMSDTVKYILKNPKLFTIKSPPILKKN